MDARVLFLLVSALLAAAVEAVSAEQEVDSSSLLSGPRIAVSSGYQAGLGQFGHQALVLSDQQLVCGGSLISTTAVLTSAYCTFRYQTWSIRLGGVHRTEEEATAWVSQSSWAATHPQFNLTAYNSHSVAVVFLPEEAPLNSFIDLVALPSPQEVGESFVGQRALVSGWGYTGNASGYSETLLWTEVTVVPNAVCSQFYEGGAVIDSTLCAGNQNPGMCSGDHGSALVLKTGGGYKQIGVAGFLMDTSCGSAGAPAAYTRLTSVLSWVAATANISLQ